MADLKTVPTKFSVDKFLKGIKDEQTREDCYEILKIMEKTTKARAKMWGPAIVGFGDHHYVYESSREGDWFITGFSPRKQNLTLYMTGGFHQFEDLMKKLGKYTMGKGCLYINKLEDVDTKVLKEIITKSVKAAKIRSKE
jgi:uncharacterized protein YdhG (YjbR/CyaY superfamily)